MFELLDQYKWIFPLLPGPKIAYKVVKGRLVNRLELKEKKNRRSCWVSRWQRVAHSRCTWIRAADDVTADDSLSSELCNTEQCDAKISQKNLSCRLSLPLPLFCLTLPSFPSPPTNSFLFLALIYLRWAVVTSWVRLWRRHCVCTATTEGRAKQSLLPRLCSPDLDGQHLFYFTDLRGWCTPSERTSAACGLSCCSCCGASDAQKDRSPGCITLLLLFVIFTAALLSSQGYMRLLLGHILFLYAFYCFKLFLVCGDICDVLN